MRLALLYLVLAAIYFGNQPRELRKYAVSSDRSYDALVNVPGLSTRTETKINWSLAKQAREYLKDDSSVVGFVMCGVSFGYTVGDYVTILDSLSQ